MAYELFLQISCDCSELRERGFQILDDLGGDHVGIGQVGGVFEASSLSQKMSRLALSRLSKLLVGEASRALGFFSLVAILRGCNSDEVVEVGALQRLGLQREMLVGAEVVDPKRLGPRRFGWPACGRRRGRSL